MSKSRGRRIAFDYGQVRIGVAVCDPDAILATPLPFLSTSHPKVLKEILTLLEEYQPIIIFVGYPKLLSGESGPSVLLVDSFIEKLKTITSIPIITIDERLSTVAAGRKLRDSGKSSKDARMHIDSMAAVTILESGLANEDRTQS
jgi:putative Holliday junction resolvase